MKNNKGFMFVEIIVMSMILMIGLLVIYKNFTSSFAVQKAKQYHNMVADDYKLYYLIRYIDETNKETGGFFSNLASVHDEETGEIRNEIQYNHNVNKLIYRDKCENENIECNKINLCADDVAGEVCSVFGIDKSYLVQEKKEGTNKKFKLPDAEQSDTEFVGYFELSQNCTLKKLPNGNYNDNLCIVGKFNNENTIGKTTYSSISYPFSIKSLNEVEDESRE